MNVYSGDEATFYQQECLNSTDPCHSAAKLLHTHTHTYTRTDVRSRALLDPASPAYWRRRRDNDYVAAKQRQHRLVDGMH